MEFNSDSRKKLEFIRPSDFVTIKEDEPEEGAVGGNVIDLTMGPDDGLEAQVYLRLRPICHLLADNYETKDNLFIIRRGLLKSNEIVEKSFEFTKIFDGATTQKVLYEQCVSQSISQVADIDGATFLTYGTSGSGKTHTVMGTTDEPGIVPRAIIQLFNQYGPVVIKKPLFKTDFQKRTQLMLNDDDVTYEIEYSGVIVDSQIAETAKFQAVNQTITHENSFPLVDTSEIRYVNIYVSFIEIYNEVVRDLLDLEGGRRSGMKIMGNDGDSYVAGAQWVFAPDAEALYKIVEYGIKNMKFGETKVNARSSRSHTVMMVDVVSLYKDRSTQSTLFKFCDLAGSERMKKTNAAGDRLTEAKQINKSLMTLGRCLQIIHNNQRNGSKSVVPVRDSKLTFLLQSALLGQQKLVMVVNLQPAQTFYDENINVLNFSSIAKQIVKTKTEVKRERRSSKFSSLFSLPVRPSSLNSEGDSDLISRLVDENEHLKLENAKLREDLVLQEMEIKRDMIASFEETKARRDALHEYSKKNAVEIEARRWELKNEHLRRKNERLQEDLDDANDEIEALEQQISDLKRRLAIFEYRSRDNISSIEVEDEDDEEDDNEMP